MKHLLFLAVVVLLPAGSAEALAANAAVKACTDKGNARIKTIDQQLKAFGIKNPQKPCPEQDGYDDKKQLCSKEVEKMRGFEAELRALLAQKCEYAEQLRSLPTEKKLDGQLGAQDMHTILIGKAHDVTMQEIAKIDEIRASLKKVRDLQVEIAEGAKSVQEFTENKAVQDRKGHDEHVDAINRAGRERGVNAQNFGDTTNFWKDSIGSVSGVIEKAKQTLLTLKDVNSIKTPLTREPLAVAAAADDWDQQMLAQRTHLQNQASVLDVSSATTKDNAAKLSEAGGTRGTGVSGDANSSSGSGTSGGSTASTLGSTSNFMQASSGLAGLAGGSAAPSTGSTAPTAVAAAPSASGDNGSAASGGAAGGADATAENANAPAANPNTTVKTAQTGSTLVPGATPTGAGDASAASQSADGKNQIQNLNSVLAADETATPANASARSSNGRGSALRDSLRTRLEADGGGTGGGDATYSASTGGAPTSRGGSAEAAANAEAGVTTSPARRSAEDSAPMLTNTFELGNTSFSLAGSETDAAVTGLLKELGGDPTPNYSPEEGRAPASISTRAAPEILAAETPDLFARTRQTHLRSLKKGLVINGLRARLEFDAK